jgi:hypothetical protein
MSANYFSTCGCLCWCHAALGPSATPYYGHVVCRRDEGDCDEERAAAEEPAQKVKSV